MTTCKTPLLAAALAGALLSLGSSPASAGSEKPIVAVSRNWPATLTVSWIHLGQTEPGDALWRYDIEEQLPTGELKRYQTARDVRTLNVPYPVPNQTHRFRVCAVYNFNWKCSNEDGVGWTSYPTPAAPPPVASTDPSSEPQRLPTPVIRGERIPIGGDTPLYNVRLTWTNPVNATQMALIRRIDWYRNGAYFNGSSPKPEMTDTLGPRERMATNRYKLCIENAANKVCSEEITVAPPPVASNDFNGDSHGDILWHNASNGESQVWSMTGAYRTGRATVTDGTRPLFIGAPWHIVGSRDFNGDRKSDVLWHNSSTGEIQLWFMEGARLAGRATVVGQDGRAIYIGPPWTIVGTSDMNGDRRSDILWHNSATGETQVWFMDGHKLAGRATLLGENGSAIYVGAPWRIAGTNDVNGDGKPDIVWHNGTTGETQLWFMNGHRLAGRATVVAENGGAIAVGLPWRVAGTNDFNQDGKADILWHNGSTGETQMWFMNGRSIVRRATVNAASDGGGAFVGLPWSIMNQ